MNTIFLNSIHFIGRYGVITQQSVLCHPTPFTLDTRGQWNGVPIGLADVVVRLGSQKAIEGGEGWHCVCSHVVKVEPVAHGQFWHDHVTDLIQSVTSGAPEARGVVWRGRGVVLGGGDDCLKTGQRILYSVYVTVCVLVICVGFWELNNKKPVCQPTNVSFSTMSPPLLVTPVPLSNLLNSSLPFCCLENSTILPYMELCVCVLLFVLPSNKKLCLLAN